MTSHWSRVKRLDQLCFQTNICSYPDLTVLFQQSLM